MPSEADICSNALRMLGANPIVSLLDDSPEARLCNGLYVSSRDYLVSLHPWNFCKARALLAQLGTNPAFDFTVQYSLPADFISVIKVFPANAYYKIEGRNLLAYQTGLKLVYKSRTSAEDASLFPAYFTTALEYYMAYRLSFSLYRKDGTADRMMKDFGMHLQLAKAANDHEDSQDYITSDLLIDVRVE